MVLRQLQIMSRQKVNTKKGGKKHITLINDSIFVDFTDTKVAQKLVIITKP